MLIDILFHCYCSTINPHTRTLTRNRSCAPISIIDSHTCWLCLSIASSFCLALSIFLLSSKLISVFICFSYILQMFCLFLLFFFFLYLLIDFLFYYFILCFVSYFDFIACFCVIFSCTLLYLSWFRTLLPTYPTTTTTHTLADTFCSIWKGFIIIIII